MASKLVKYICTLLLVSANLLVTAQNNCFSENLKGYVIHPTLHEYHSSTAKYKNIDIDASQKAVDVLKKDLNKLFKNYLIKNTPKSKSYIIKDNFYILSDNKIFGNFFISLSDIKNYQIDAPDFFNDNYMKFIFKQLNCDWQAAKYENEAIGVGYKLYCSLQLILKRNGLAYAQIDSLSLTPNPKRSTNGKKYYSSSYDNIESAIFRDTEISPNYYGGISGLKFHLNQLLSHPNSEITNGFQDSLTINFYINRPGQLQGIQTIKKLTEADQLILDKIKDLSVNWNPAIMGSRPVNCFLTFTIYYLTVDEKSYPKVFVKDIVSEKKYNPEFLRSVDKMEIPIKRYQKIFPEVLTIKRLNVLPKLISKK